MSARSRWLTTGAAAGLIAALAGFAVAQGAPKKAAAEIPELPPIEDLSTTAERPLFVRTRRPPEVAAVADAAKSTAVTVASEEAPADLTGIVSGPDRAYAILTSRATKEVHHLRKGETIDDWSIQEIGPRHVVLRRGVGSLRLELFEEKEPGTEPANRVNGDVNNRVRRQPQNTRQRFTPQAPQIRQPVRQPARQRPRPNRQTNRRTREE